MAALIETTTGLVLRTWPLTETSLIIHWLTRDLGRIATVAKGARRPKSPFRGKLDLFYLADLSFSRSQRSDLHNLREVSLRQTHNPLRRELGYLEQASYCAALIEQATEPETPLPAVFDLMRGMLDYLPTRTPEPQTVFAFEFKLLADLGLQPDLKESHLNPGTSKLVRAFTESDWTALARLRPSEAQVDELQAFLNKFLIFHLGKVPKARDAALDCARTKSRRGNESSEFQN
jgi:DNA repair protein RecO (recombination protein O)